MNPTSTTPRGARADRPGARVSACVVVKDEATVLRSALDGVRDHVDEIIVVDGGSSDDSVAIAESCGAQVFVDLGDVSAARNRAIREAKGDYCLMIDGDEIVDVETWPFLSEFIREARHPRGRIQQISLTVDGLASVWLTRLCANDGRFHYEGSVHEQLVGPGSIGKTGLSVRHSGYAPETLARKGTSDRNLRLLRSELAKWPTDPYLNYQLGKTLRVAGRVAESLAPFAIAAARVPPGASYASSLACDFGYALKDAGQPLEALALVRVFLREFADYTDLWFLEGLCHLAVGNAEEMVFAFEKCIALGEAPDYATVQGVGTFRASYNLGIYHELCGNNGRARELYLQALDSNPSFAPASARLAGLR